MKLSGGSFRETDNRLISKRLVLLISYFRDEIMVLNSISSSAYYCTRLTALTSFSVVGEIWRWVLDDACGVREATPCC